MFARIALATIALGFLSESSCNAQLRVVVRCDGKPAVQALVEVQTERGRELIAQGRTDKAGMFSFPEPNEKDMYISVRPQMRCPAMAIPVNVANAKKDKGVIIFDLKGVPDRD